MISLISIHATAPIDEARILMLIESWYRWLNLNIDDPNLLYRDTEFDGIEILVHTTPPIDEDRSMFD